MLDEYKEDQKVIYQILKNAVEKNKYSHAYIFETNGNKDALSLALSFSKYLLCPKKYSNNKKCVDCTQCNRIDKNEFTELKIIYPDGMWIKKEQLIELKNEFKNKSIEADKKVYIISDASKLNESSSNSLLKFLEEPEDNIIAILLVDNVHQLLDTIISRCQIISIKNKNLNNDIKSNLSNYDEELDIDEIIVDTIKFTNYLEKNRIITLLNTKKLFMNKFTEKQKIILFFEIMTLYYKDIINIKLNRKRSFFQDDYMITIAKNNNLNQLNKKINIILNLKEKIYVNVNLNLLVDKLIIEVGGVK